MQASVLCCVMVVVRAAVTILALRDVLLVWVNVRLGVAMAALELVSQTVQVILNIQHTSNNSHIKAVPAKTKVLYGSKSSSTPKAYISLCANVLQHLKHCVLTKRIQNSFVVYCFEFNNSQYTT